MGMGLMVKKFQERDAMKTNMNNVFISVNDNVNILDWAHSVLRIKDILKESPDVCFPITCNYGDFEVLVTKEDSNIEDILRQIQIGR